MNNSQESLCEQHFVASIGFCSILLVGNVGERYNNGEKI